MHAYYYILRQMFQSWPQEMNCAIIGQVQSSTNVLGCRFSFITWWRVCGVHNFDACQKLWMVNSNTFPLHTHIQPIYWFFDGMREINNNVICSVLFKYKCVGSDEQEIILVWPYLCINRDKYENCSKKASDNMDERFTSFMYHCNTHTNTCY